MIEVGRTARGERRVHGKDDALDAVRAARSALASKTLTLPRAGQRQEALRVLLLTRRSAVDVRRLALVQLRSVIVTAPGFSFGGSRGPGSFFFAGGCEHATHSIATSSERTMAATLSLTLGVFVRVLELA